MASLFARLGLAATLVLTATVGPSFVGGSPVASADPAGWKHKVDGGLQSAAVACPTICTAGDLTGDLAGPFSFTMTGMGSTEDPEVVAYSGWIVYHTEQGDVVGVGTGLWNVVTGDVVDTVIITGGTGEWEGAWGEVITAGLFDPVAGVGDSGYEGEIYTPKNKKKAK